MVIDDDQMILDLFDAGQIVYNYRIVATAATGEDALNKYSRIIPRPDIILLDQHMPKMCGIECMKRIFQIDPNAKIVFVSADLEVRNDALAFGAIDFVAKPFAMPDLIDYLNHIQNDSRISG